MVMLKLPYCRKPQWSMWRWKQQVETTAPERSFREGDGQTKGLAYALAKNAHDMAD
jgi:hypothetical protein